VKQLQGEAHQAWRVPSTETALKQSLGGKSESVEGGPAVELDAFYIALLQRGETLFERIKRNHQSGLCRHPAIKPSSTPRMKNGSLSRCDRRRREKR
jgi:hypothetical protein